MSEQESNKPTVSSFSSSVKKILGLNQSGDTERALSSVETTEQPELRDATSSPKVVNRQSSGSSSNSVRTPSTGARDEDKVTASTNSENVRSSTRATGTKQDRSSGEKRVVKTSNSRKRTLANSKSNSVSRRKIPSIASSTSSGSSVSHPVQNVLSRDTRLVQEHDNKNTVDESTPQNNHTNISTASNAQSSNRVSKDKKVTALASLNKGG